MKERIAAARRAYERIPKYGYIREPKPLTDLQLVTAFFHEDLASLRAIPSDKADERTVRRALKAAEKLVASATAVLVMRDDAERAKATMKARADAEEADQVDGCTCPDIHACPFHGPPT
jgi:hypothetical protein